MRRSSGCCLALGGDVKRLLVVYNPRSSRYAEVREGVLCKVRDLPGYMVGKYEVEKIGIEGNVTKLTGILQDGDTVVTAGGDATGVIAVNAILQSDCRDVTLAVLPYGNFNDLARTLGTKTFEDIFDEKVKKLYPLEIIVDEKHWRYATCYVTVGMMAEAVKIYDQSKMRKLLKGKLGRYIGSYTNLAGWYFKNRRKKVWMPEFKLNGALQDKRISDYFAVNGRYMARVMKGGESYLEKRTFLSGVGGLVCFLRLVKFMIESMLTKVPGMETTGDVLEFNDLATVKIQAEGESQAFTGVKKIEIKKTEKYLKVMTRR